MNQLKAICTLLLLLLLLSCEKDENEDFGYICLKGINLEPTVLSLGESCVLNSDLEIVGHPNLSDISYYWKCSEGDISDNSSSNTFWTAPSEIGNYKIELTVNYKNEKFTSDILVKVVNSPAKDWGSISGFLLDIDKEPLTEIVVSTVTGEFSLTDHEGFFYIKDIPQGETGILFDGIEFNYAAALPCSIEVKGGSHMHIDNIYILESECPDFITIESMPGNRIYFKWGSVDPNIYQYVEFYSGSNLMNRFGTDVTELTLEDVTNSTWKIRAIPYYGDASDFKSIYEEPGEVYDPSSDFSTLTYSNFYEASITWSAAKYENYLDGYKIAKLQNSSWSFISDLIPINKYYYELETYPNESSIYYVISIADNGDYNNSQSNSKRIYLNIPALISPEDFDATYNSENNNIELIWNLNSLDNKDWYDGIIIKKCVGTIYSSTIWEDLETMSINQLSYTDLNPISGKKNNYRIYTYSINPRTQVKNYSTYQEITINVP